MKLRAEAIERLRQQEDTVRPDLPYNVGPFRPDDAEGVARLFFRTYGDTYPIDRYYIPEQIIAAVREDALAPTVARLDGGEVVGFAALYRSTPPFTGLWEFGLGMVHPAYRGSFILFHLYNATVELMQSRPDVEAVFGENVCDTIITQQSSALFGFREAALELDLMPGAGSGRISCLLMARNFRDRRRTAYLPPCCYEGLEAVIARLGLDREVLTLCGGVAPLAGATRVESRVFAHAGVLRGNVFHLAADGPDTLAALEAEAAAGGCRVFQWFLNLAEPSAAAAADLLLARGYLPGGLAPRWFDDDAVLMQKNLDPPCMANLNLYSDTAREIQRMAWPG